MRPVAPPSTAVSSGESSDPVPALPVAAATPMYVHMATPPPPPSAVSVAPSSLPPVAAAASGNGSSSDLVPRSGYDASGASVPSVTDAPPSPSPPPPPASAGAVSTILLGPSAGLPSGVATKSGVGSGMGAPPPPPPPPPPPAPATAAATVGALGTSGDGPGYAEYTVANFGGLRNLDTAAMLAAAVSRGAGGSDVNATPGDDADATVSGFQAVR